MTELKAIYLIVSGASSARCTPDLVQELAQFNLPLYTLLTDAARNIISPYNLADQQGHRLVDNFFDPILLDGRKPGLTLVAPATFNTLNKISHGIADTFPHSLAAEAIGAGWPVIIVPSMNLALANHPQVAQSLKILQQWGVTVLEPQPKGDLLMMASIEKIIARVKATLRAVERGTNE
jgi:phosphopantothenoylcysteine decarboxylase/phosphopantothenate--cysteine ligase